MNYKKEELECLNDLLFLILEWRFARISWYRQYWMMTILEMAREVFDRLFIDEFRAVERNDENFINQLEQIILERLEIVIRSL